MDDRRRFRLLWKTLDGRRRGEVRRYALLGRQATDPETAWLIAMFAGKGVGLWADVVYLGVGVLAWIVPGAVAVVLVVGRRGFSAWVLLWPLGQIVIGIVMLWLLLNLRRARRLNASVAVPPGGRRATDLGRLPAAKQAALEPSPGSTCQSSFESRSPTATTAGAG